MNESNNTVVLTGAGVSTDSGIPDFRSPSGAYARWDSNRVFDIGSFREDPGYFFDYAREELFPFAEKRPNPTHVLLARLERLGKVKAVITQNIDRLHQRAGSSNVLEIHGTMETSHCLRCGASFSFEAMKEKVYSEKIPRCPCGGVVKPDIVFFGEPLPEETIRASVAYAGQAGLFITMGTSLVVYPAAAIPMEAKEAGAKLVIVNREQ